MVAPYLQCMMMVSSFHHLPPNVLPSIQRVEGGAPGAVSNNKNGTQDLGVMQINTRWIEPLRRTTGEAGEIVYKRLKEDSCYNIAVAGAIMKLYLKETNGDLMQAIGNYHSHTPSLNNQYQLKIVNASYKTNVSDISLGKHLSPYQRRLLKARSKPNRYHHRKKYQRS
ncbi:lytic transglycosylase domain-containing protein [Commensalibacter nepenthis]|uniref:Lytic transglycosylase domain-containing protein n=1 Tax=Commensalibacter nepenthis TaxID=3043872 RepID=A0ABT6Q7S3_9PROT|nr:lytic transglycosylase domain-containing protein [Commensalibacter sp. TBRC 10068]MDI2112948.1 lytic transglycosylase domain-containing protein [Commensalibacter sp. TBRC 10068]